MELNEERKNRYLSKMGYILEKMYSLPDNTTAMDELEIDGVLYRVQTSIDVGDDYENIDILKENKVIDSELADELKRLNGMRNAIVHKYESVNIKLILQNLGTVKEQLRRFVDAIEGELS